MSLLPRRRCCRKCPHRLTIRVIVEFMVNPGRADDGREPNSLAIAEQDLIAARKKFLTVIQATAGVAFVLIGALTYGAAVIAVAITDGRGAQYATTAAFLSLVAAPVLVVAVKVVVRQVKSADAVADARQHRLDAEGRHRDLESKLADALEMADNESEALRVIERSFATVLPRDPIELLLADNSHAHLTRRASTSPEGVAADCHVGSPQECPAARRARVHQFPDSEAINACPKLAEREQGRCSAVCIPVSVMGRTVGVIHSVQEFGRDVDESEIRDLQSVANQSGARLGMLRIMAETQLQASTDGLTGLLNRRAFENEFLALRGRSRHSSAVVAMADLDHFKMINDTYGHETGDRALRTFADTLRLTLRDKDLLCRRGGEEFAIVFPECDLASATAVLERIRHELDESIKTAGLPSFTVSMGAIPARLTDDLDDLLSRADIALFEAKRSGRNRVVVHESELDAAKVDEGLAGWALATPESTTL